MYTHQNLTTYFANELEVLECDEDTRAYIVSVFGKFRDATFDYSKQSITLLYSDATIKQDFFTFQNIGDWLFASYVMWPAHLNNASHEYYSTIGRLSYYSCYRLLQRRWRLYEELSDQFIPLSNEVRDILIHKP